MRWQGSGSTDRQGAVWAITDEDHPAAMLGTTPKKVKPRTTTQVALTIAQVRIASNNLHFDIKLKFSDGSIHHFP